MRLDHKMLETIERMGQYTNLVPMIGLIRHIQRNDVWRRRVRVVRG